MLLRTTLAFAAALFAIQPEEAKAVPVSTALMLAIDGSGSISPDYFDLQIDAYETLLGYVPTDGSVAIGVIQFAKTTEEVFTLTQIDSADTLGDLTTAVGSTTQIGGPPFKTNISPAIAQSSKALVKNYDCKSEDVDCLIDVSTDGFNTGLIDPKITSVLSVIAGVDQVNCLGLGRFSNCGFTAGEGSFAVKANTVEDFADTLRVKLEREGVIEPVPLPAPLALLGAGLIGLFGLRARRNA